MIRKAEEADAQFLTDMNKALFTYNPWTLEQFLYEMNENPFAAVYVYEEDGEIYGYCDMWITYEQAQIAHIGVAPEHQRQGVASKLMDHCIREAVLNGCENVTLEVRVTNDAAVSMYEKYGFIQAARRKNYYENKEDAWLMIKPVGGLEYDDDTGDRDQL